jgi:hypothetical protein
VIDPEMSYTTRTVPSMNEPPRRHDITIRIATEPGRQPGPAASAVTASRAAAAQNASILTAHTAEEIVSILAATGPEATAIALAVVAGALKAGRKAVPSPSR